MSAHTPTVDELALQIIKFSPAVPDPRRFYRHLTRLNVDLLGQRLASLLADQVKGYQHQPRRNQ